MGFMLIDAAIARIRAYRQAQRWSVNRLATEARIGESTIRRLDSPDWNPATETLRRLEAIIPSDFMSDPASPVVPGAGDAAPAGAAP
jgi:transcriptional regulator with XRE-family HTH domain